MVAASTTTIDELNLRLLRQAISRTINRRNRLITINPTKRILATNPYPQNPLGIQVYVSDAEARDAVNKLSGEPWVNIGFRASGEGKEIIEANKLEGFFTYNPCFEMADVIAAIESAMD